MAGEFLEKGHGHELQGAIDALALSLEHRAPFETLLQADTVSHYLHLDPVSLMRMTIHRVLDSDDQDAHGHAIAYLKWESADSPSLRMADELSDRARSDMEVGGRQQLAEKEFDLSLAHLYNLAMDDDFRPDADYVRQLCVTLDRIGEQGDQLFEKYSTAGVRFCAVTFAAFATATDEERASHAPGSVNELASHIASGLEPSNPELAATMREHMTEGSWKEIAQSNHFNFELNNALLIGDFTLVEQLVEGCDHNVDSQVWRNMSYLYGYDQFDKAWGDRFIDTLLTKRPTYFNEYSKSGFQDYRIGREGGYMLALLGRHDVIETLFEPQAQTNDSGMITAAGVVKGFGQREDYRGMVMLKARIPHFTEPTYQVLVDIFNDALSEPHETKDLY